MLDDLISRLEAATEGSRELDAEIFRWIGLTERQERHCRDWCRMDGRTGLTREHYIGAWAPAFTESVDDAMTLLPEGAWFLLGAGKTRPDEPLYGALIMRAGDIDGPALGEGEHPTSLPTATVIACLRARSTLPETEGT